MGRDDCLRSLRMLLREVVRNVKHDMNFHTFAVSLMRDPSDTKLPDLDPILKASFFFCQIVLHRYSQIIFISNIYDVWIVLFWNICFYGNPLQHLVAKL